MRTRVSARLLALAAATACIGSAAAGRDTDATLDFDRTFQGRGEPAQAHFRAIYRLADGEHRLEVWREGERRLRRRTDDRLETLVDRPEGSVEWSMTQLDLKRRIRTDVGRTNLLRIGHAADWFGLAHSLSHPAGAYRLAVLPAAERPTVAALSACRWYALTQGERTTKVCWSSVHRLPMLITSGHDEVVWKVTAVDEHALAPGTFVVDDSGFVRNDANADIQAD